MSALSRSLLGYALLLLVLAGCRSAPTRLYTVRAAPVGARHPDYRGPAMRVDTFHIPPGLDRSQVLWTIAPGELDIDDFAYWAAPLAQLGRQALSQDLLALFPAGRVAFPDLPKPKGALGIDVDLLTLRVRDGQALLMAGWSISAPGGEASSERGTATLEVTAGSGAAGVAEAYGVLLGQLAERIGDDLAAHDDGR